MAEKKDENEEIIIQGVTKVMVITQIKVELEDFKWSYNIALYSPLLLVNMSWSDYQRTLVVKYCFQIGE